MSVNIEIFIKGKDIQFYKDEELIYESEVTAQPVYMVEGLLFALGWNVDILDVSEDDVPTDDSMEPYYEENPLDQIED